MHKIATVLALAVGLLLTSCNKDKGIKIAVIPKGTSHVFWKAVEAGARKAGAENNVTIIWKGPLKEDDTSGQIDIVDQFVSNKVSGICVAPLDASALLTPIQAAGAPDKQIPVVIFDSALNGQVGKDFVSFVATDSRKGGRMAGAELARLLGEKGNVFMLRYKEGHASTNAREEGFLEEIAKYPNLHVIQKDTYGGADASQAQTAAENLYAKLLKADGIFCPNESSTQGMLSALEGRGLAGKVKFVGFDTSPPLLDGLRKGEINALIAQDPQKMGYEAVNIMVKKLKGETVPQYVDTGVKLVTKENLDNPDVKSMIGN